MCENRAPRVNEHAAFASATVGCKIIYLKTAYGEFLLISFAINTRFNW